MAELRPEDWDEIQSLSERLNALIQSRVFTGAAPVAPPPAVNENRSLVHQDYVDAAQIIGCDVAAVYAVQEVESRGHGFIEGRPIVLYEPHVFSRLTDHRFDKTHGGVSYPTWGMKPYPKGTDEERNRANWDKILFALKLDPSAALQSASYGLFQIMGFNWKACGFRTVDAFVEAMKRSARDHLMAFIQFILHEGLDDEIRDHRWAAFAARYNGPGYKKNAYDTKLAAAHLKHTKRLAA